MAELDFGLHDLTATTLTALLRGRAEHRPDHLAFAFLSDATAIKDKMTYADLDRSAQRIAGMLRAENFRAEPVLLLYTPSLEYVAAFFGCLYAGAVAVPAYPPHRNRSLDRLCAIVRDSGARVVLCSEAVKSAMERSVAEFPELRSLRWIVTDAPDAAGESYFDESATPETLAFLQYTSGSTSSPKGVMLSHGNLCHNARLITEGFQFGADSTSVFWLPLYHDMGLIGGVLQPMHIGRTSYLMAPATFLSRPLRWLQAISHFKATISGAPNFAYELCAAKVTREELRGLDLGHWRVAFNGAEPVRAETLDRFATVFAPCGFRAEAAYPCYGLAESTLIVTGGKHDHPPVTLSISRPALEQHRVQVVSDQHAEARVVVGCGEALLDTRLAIVDPETGLPCRADVPGEIWISSLSVAQGYWQKPDLTAATFQARTADGDGPFLRTGDLGFLHDGELFITGRIKDLIILRGRNHYPQDIEQTVEQSHPSIRAGCCAAFAVEDGDGERLIITAEAERSGRHVPVGVIANAVRRAVAEHHDVMIDGLVLLKPGSVPKTSSGKIQRHACKSGFLDATLTELGRWDATAQVATTPLPASATPAGPNVGVIRDWLVERIAARLRVDRSAVDPREPLASLGLDSLAAVQLSGELEQWLARPVSPVIIYDHPTIDALARFLADESAVEPAGDSVPTDDRAIHEIAVVGIGCRFPGAVGPRAFWKLLRAGEDAISKVPGDRWNADEFFSSDPAAAGKMTTRHGGFIRDVDQFDRGFFGISPREAERMDPQQRLLLEVAWEAFEDAGHDVERLAGKPVGVFVGIASNDYGRLQAGDLGALDAYVGTGNAMSIAANRLSYTFDFRGPSLAVDTACSSSLVAIHLACESLRRGESTMAVAAGVNLILTPDLTINFSRANMMAPDGRCKAFDASADGYVRSEGVGVVILKPLAQALADGDRVYAVVRGSAVNQDGRSNGLTAPNRQSQEAVLRAAYANAGVSPGEIDAIEAHGTGTALGDPIEALALGHVLAQDRPADRPAWLGSVKTNIGHLEAAAGVAGFIKMALALHHGELPANLHFDNPNPHIPFGELPLRVATEWQSLYERVQPAIVGVSSFGFGGTNAHIVLQGVEPQVSATIPDNAAHVIPLSARSPEALKALVQRWIEFCDTGSNSVVDLAFTAARRRSHHDHRVTIVARDPASLSDQLQAFLDDSPRAGTAAGRKSSREPRIAFVFSGQGSQWWGMGRDLLDREPVFRTAIDRCDAIFQPLAGWSLLDVLRRESQPSRLDDTDIVQPVIFALQVALAELWRSWGIAPSAVAGHSLGEVAAAYASGALGLEDAVRVVWHRARLQHETRGCGKMAAVGLSPDESRTAINGLHDHITVAAINAPNSTVWSGNPAAIEKALASLRQRNVFHRLLRGQVAFHSAQMAPLQPAFVDAIKDLRPQTSRLPFISTVTGREERGESLTAEYWSRNLREPVLFADAAATLITSGIDIVLEIGPHPVLTEPLNQVAQARSAALTILSSLRRTEDSRTALLQSLAALYTRGVTVAWDRVEPSGKFVALPTYAWQGERCWHEISGARNSTIAAAPQSALPTKRERRAADYDPWLVQTQWAPTELATKSGSLAGTWILVGSESPALDRLADVMRGRGATIVTAVIADKFEKLAERRFSVNPSDGEQYRRLVRDASPSGANFRGVIHLNTNVPASDGLSVAQLQATQESGCISVLHLVQSLVHHGVSTRLWIVTRGAQGVRAGESASVAAAPLWGFGRVLAREHPELRTTLVDLDPNPRSDDFTQLAAMLSAEPDEDQYARRDGRVLAARLVPAAQQLPGDVPTMHADATYLLTGGLGGLGLAAANWLVERGARTLVLTSRRGATPEVETDLAVLRSRGATVIVVQADAADSDQLDAVFSQIDHELPPLRGVLHLAGVLDDGIALHLDRQRVWKVLTPKLLGAWNLHVRTAGRQLDFFSLFSSVASLIGSPGQSNYAAANAFLDALAQHRRARNLPATSVNWGPWAQVGMAARDSRGSRLAATGMVAIEPAIGLEIMGRSLTADFAQLGVLPVEPAAWQRFAPGGQAPPYLAALIHAANGSAVAEKPVAIASALDRAALLAVPPDDWQPILEEQLRHQAARVLKLAPAALDVEQPLSNLGIDSLMAIELKNRIEADFGTTVPMVKFLEGPSVRELSAFLADQLVPLLAPMRRSATSLDKNQLAAAVAHTNGNGHSAANGSTNGKAEAGEAADAGQLLARIDTLSDEEVDSLLQELCDAEKGD